MENLNCTPEQAEGFSKYEPGVLKSWTNKAGEHIVLDSPKLQLGGQTKFGRFGLSAYQARLVLANIEVVRTFVANVPLSPRAAKEAAPVESFADALKAALKPVAASAAPAKPKGK